MEELQAPSVEGAKAPDLWEWVLETYAELLGTKTRFARKKRKDAGSTREPRLVNTKTGKLTEVGFKRRRAATVAETHVAEAQPRNVFGDHIQRALQEQSRRDLNRDNTVFEIVLTTTKKSMTPHGGWRMPFVSEQLMR